MEKHKIRSDSKEFTLVSFFLRAYTIYFKKLKIYVKIALFNIKLSIL